MMPAPPLEAGMANAMSVKPGGETARENAMATGFAFHEQLMWHDTGSSADMMPPGKYVEPGRHLESPGSKRRLANLMQVSGLARHLVPITPEAVDEDDLRRVHTQRHIDAIRGLSEGGTAFAGPQAPIGVNSYEIALLSAGATYAAIRAVMSGRVDNAYALARPPGHHAEPDQAMGNCLFSNIGVSIRKAQAEGILGRVAVVDWDVHHGNGTETIFYDDPSVLAISLHQDNLYPTGRGGLDRVGAGAGEGCNINIPLPAGSGIGAYEAAFDRVVLPAVRAYRPDLIVVASGFDASAFDPLGRMMLNSECFRRLAARMVTLAAESSNGRLVLTHEGGYSEGYVPFCGHAVIETLANHRTDVVDPLSDHIEEWSGQALEPHQDAVIKAAEKLLVGLRRKIVSAA